MKYVSKLADIAACSNPKILYESLEWARFMVNDNRLSQSSLGEKVWQTRADAIVKRINEMVV